MSAWAELGRRRPCTGTPHGCTGLLRLLPGRSGGGGSRAALPQAGPGPPSGTPPARAAPTGSPSGGSGPSPVGLRGAAVGPGIQDRAAPPGKALPEIPCVFGRNPCPTRESEDSKPFLRREATAPPNPDPANLEDAPTHARPRSSGASGRLRPFPRAEGREAHLETRESAWCLALRRRVVSTTAPRRGRSHLEEDPHRPTTRSERPFGPARGGSQGVNAATARIRVPHGSARTEFPEQLAAKKITFFEFSLLTAEMMLV